MTSELEKQKPPLAFKQSEELTWPLPEPNKDLQQEF